MSGKDKYARLPHCFQVGDLVRYKYKPEMIGIVVEVVEKENINRGDCILIWWQVPWRRPGEYNIKEKNKWRVSPQWIERVRPS